MPPSLIGMRMQEALKRRFMALGGTFLTSERVLGARYDGDRVIGVHSQNGDDQLFEADHFVLASGSFFSRGLESRLRGIREPIFNADVLSLPERDAWAAAACSTTTPSWASGSRPTTSSGCCVAASRSPTSTAPAACWRTMTPLKKVPAPAWPLPPAGKPLAIFWRRAEMNHIFPPNDTVCWRTTMPNPRRDQAPAWQLPPAGRLPVTFEFSPMMILSHIPCLHAQREEN